MKIALIITGILFLIVIIFIGFIMRNSSNCSRIEEARWAKEDAEEANKRNN